MPLSPHNPPVAPWRSRFARLLPALTLLLLFLAALLPITTGAAAPHHVSRFTFHVPTPNLQPSTFNLQLSPTPASGVFTRLAVPAFARGGRQVTLADLDRDGDLDAIVDSTVWRNDGRGRFTGGDATPIPGDYGDLDLGDLDGDGDPDALVAYQRAASIFLNDGTGGFGLHFSFGETSVRGGGLGDIDGDGDIDAILARDLVCAPPPANHCDLAPESVWLNDGAANFAPHPTVPAFGGDASNDHHSRDAQLADLDGDDDLDAIVASEGPPHRVWLNDGGGAFSLHPTARPFGISVLYEQLADLDGDGDLDAIERGYPYYPYKDAVVWRNDGTGSFTRRARLPGTVNALGDLDGDGDIDAAVDAAIWLNAGTGVFTPHPAPSPVGDGARFDALGDLDGDGDLDAIVHLDEAKTVWVNAPDLAISKSVAPSRPLAGEPITFTLVYSYYGPTASGVRIRDVLPLEIVSPSVTSRGPAITPTGGSRYTWRLAPLAHGTTGSIQITGIVSPGLDIGTTFTNTAEIDGDLREEADNNSSTVLVRVISPHGVRAVAPRPAAPSVAPTATLSATFEAPVDPGTLDEQSFFVHGALTGRYPGTLTYDDTSRTATLDPAGAFKPGETIFATASSRIHDASGESIRPFIWQFTAATAGGLGVFERHPTNPVFSFVSEMGDVALGDVDGDLDLDALILTQVPGYGGEMAVTVWLNDGRGGFDPAPSQPLGRYTTAYGLALGDLDGDGDLDAVVTGNWNGDSIWLNAGDGTFSYHGSLPTGGAFDVALGDLDGDGDLDALLSIFREEPPYPAPVWLNDGRANFTARPATHPPDRLHAAALGDLDGDGDLDAIGGTGVWLNDGDGGMSAAGPAGYPAALGDLDADGDGDGGMSAAGPAGYPAALGDLDADGDLDAVGSDGVWLNDGDAAFTRSGSAQYLLDLGDLDGDGDLDALGETGVWLNDGAATFTHVAFYGGWKGRLVDLDRDGDLDAFMWGASTFRSGPVRVWLDPGSDLSLTKHVEPRMAAPGERVTYTLRYAFPGPRIATGVRLTDVVPAELTDVSVTSSGPRLTPVDGTYFAWQVEDLPPGATGLITITGRLDPALPLGTIVRNTAIIASDVRDRQPANNRAAVAILLSWRVAGVSPAPNALHVGPLSSVSATFNRDVQPDTVTTHTLTLHGSQTGRYTSTIRYDSESRTATLDHAAPFKPGETLEATASPAILADDGRPISPFVWHFRAAAADGSGIFRRHPISPTLGLGGVLIDDLALGDLDGDQDLDAVVLQTFDTGAVTLYHNDGTGRFTSGAILPLLSGSAAELSGVALGDIDGDGDLDLVISTGDYPCYCTERMGIWVNDGQGQFSPHPSSESAPFDVASALADLDGDADLDILGRSSVWLNDGSGIFVQGPTLDRDLLPGELGDLDGDGDLDTVDSDRIWLNDGRGRFKPGIYLAGISLLGDLDGDGDIDALGGSVWLNDGHARFTRKDTYASATALADLDGDGDLDALSGGSVWLNDGRATFTRYNSTFEAYLSALGDLDGDGDIDVLASEDSDAAVWLNSPPQTSLPLIRR